jgi:Domain of Unknown Function (DUF1080)
MKILPSLCALAALGLVAAPLLHAQLTTDIVNEPVFDAPRAVAAAKVGPHGEIQLFNGQDLSGWDGSPDLWSVENGAIVGKTTKATPAKGNTFLIWKGGTVGDFELTCKYKIVPGPEGFANSGIQYRSKILDPKYWVVGGYQADMEAGKTYSGIVYEERMRGILAKRGEKVVIKDGDAPGKPKIEVTGSVGNSDEIQATIKNNEWNDYKIIAKGNHLQQFINGKQTVDVTDESSVAAKSGVLALQLHAGSPMEVQFKDILYTPIK